MIFKCLLWFLSILPTRFQPELRTGRETEILVILQARNSKAFRTCPRLRYPPTATESFVRRCLAYFVQR